MVPVLSLSAAEKGKPAPKKGKPAPSEAQILVARGTAVYKKGNFVLALELFNKAAELEPNNVIIHSLRGKARYRNNDFNGAIADQTKAIELNPRMLPQGGGFVRKGCPWTEPGPSVQQSRAGQGRSSHHVIR